MENVTVVCKDCGTEFVIEAKEQEWYKEQGFELPKRCPSCRKARKQAQRERNN